MRAAAATAPRAPASAPLRAAPRGHAGRPLGEATDPVRRRPRGNMPAAPAAFAEHVDAPPAVPRRAIGRTAADAFERTGQAHRRQRGR